MPRRSPTHRTAAGAALALAVALAGCAASPEPAPTPTKTAAAPIFGSDEEAFAAAADAYARYLEVTYAASAGEVDPEALEAVSLGEALDEGLARLASYEDDGRSTTGTPTFSIAQSVQYFEVRERGAVVQIRVCEDLSRVDVVDADGNSTVGDRVHPIAPYEVVLEGMTAESLKVSEQWLGGTFCS